MSIKNRLVSFVAAGILVAASFAQAGEETFLSGTYGPGGSSKWSAGDPGSPDSFWKTLDPFTWNGGSNASALLSLFDYEAATPLSVNFALVDETINQSLVGSNLIMGSPDEAPFLAAQSFGGLVNGHSYRLGVSASFLSGASRGGEFTVTITPVPEPETYAMFLAGLGMLGTIARRRRGA
jgi:hypothetical protein